MSNTKRLWMTGALVLFIVATILGAWQYTRHEINARDVEDTLQPLAALLHEDAKILAEIQSQDHIDSDSVMLEEYLARIRKDGVPKNSALKQRIDTLVNNNTAIMTLLSRHAPRARTIVFTAEAEKFRDYASRFRDRWQSVFEIFMAGGNLPAAGPAFPKTFAEAVATETGAVQ